MAQIDYVQVDLDSESGRTHGVSVIATDPHELDWIFDQLQRLVPSCRRQDCKDVPGEICGAVFDKLGGADGQVHFWIFKQLCHRGWEPLDVRFPGTSNRNWYWGGKCRLRREKLNDFPATVD